MTTEPSQYPIVIVPIESDDGGGFMAMAPDLRGCMSDGATQEEALANLRDAIGCWIEAAKEMGRPIPKPNR